LLGIEGETCKIVLSSGPTDFRSTVVKPFLIESINDVEPTNEVQSISEVEDIQSSDTRSLATTRPTRARRLSLRYQNFADIIVFLQDDDPHSNQFENLSTPASTFAESRRKEINGLLEKRVFELIIIDAVLRNVRIFNFRFVDEIKHSGTSDVYEKSRLVVQAYNDHDKTLVLTQSSTIQRMSQRIILALAACISDCHLYLRDITQAYVQSKTPLNRQFFIRSSRELDLPKNSILRVIKPLYGVPEAGAHWFNTYQKHHKDKLSMVESTFDPCLLHTCQISQTESTESTIQSTSTNDFGVVGLQTDDTLILADDEFAALEENELARARLTSKKREKLNLTTPIKFNGGLITLADDDNGKSLHLTQPKQFDQIRLIDVKASVDLTSSRDEIRKLVTPKDQYVAQRVRGAYIVIVSQPEASFDFSFGAQVINSKKEDAKRLNQRLQWQLNNPTRGLRFVLLNRNQLRLMIFTDAAFVNTPNLHSQIGYVVCLTDDVHTNLIHWSSIKCKRVTRSVLAAELYAMTNGFDVGSVIKSTIERILKLNNPLSLILCTDSKSLYDCLVKLGTTSEKRLMIDLMCLRQSYERRQIAEIRWIDGTTNPTDAMTKSKPCPALTKLIDTNTIDVKITGWIDRTVERPDDQTP
jgi:hypothetical protein